MLQEAKHQLTKLALRTICLQSAVQDSRTRMRIPRSLKKLAAKRNRAMEEQSSRSITIETGLKSKLVSLTKTPCWQVLKTCRFVSKWVSQSLIQHRVSQKHLMRMRTMSSILRRDKSQEPLVERKLKVDQDLIKMATRERTNHQL